MSELFTKMTPSHYHLSEVLPLVCALPYYGQKQIFKFTEKQYADKMLYRGLVKIGSLYEFRNHESSFTRDPSEGLDRTDIEFVENFSKFAPESTFKSFINLEVEGGMLLDCSLVSELADQYVYCFSYKCTQSAAETLDYDSVVEISDVYLFAERIVQHCPALYGYGYFVAPVRYCNRQRSPHAPARNPVCSVFEKGLEFQGNAEGRIFFVKPARMRALAEPLEPLIWEDKRLARYMRERIFL